MKSFSNILWNLYPSENTRNPPPAYNGHEPLHKVRNILSIAKDNLTYVHKPSKDVSLDESSCPFKAESNLMLQY